MSERSVLAGLAGVDDSGAEGWSVSWSIHVPPGDCRNSGVAVEDISGHDCRFCTVRLKHCVDDAGLFSVSNTSSEFLAAKDESSE